jgi:hypothetical protein
MKRPAPKVRVWSLHARVEQGRREPFIVRWKVEGVIKPFEKPFSEIGAADEYRARLVVAVKDGQRFDRKTGEPYSWAVGEPVDVATYCKRYVDAERLTAAKKVQPRTAASYAESLCRFIEHSALPRAPKLTPEQRSNIRRWLLGEVELPTDLKRWTTKWSPLLDELTAADLTKIDRLLRLKSDGVTPAAETTATRHVGVVRCALGRAGAVVYRLLAVAA